MTEFMILALTERAPFDASLFYYAWYFEVQKHRANVFESDLWITMMSVYEEILANTSDKNGWKWLKEQFIPSLIWYLPHPYSYHEAKENMIQIDYDFDGSIVHNNRGTLQRGGRADLEFEPMNIESMKTRGFEAMEPSVQALMSTGLPDTLPQSFFDTELKEENRQNTMNPSVQALMSTGLPDTLPQSFFDTELKEENRQNTMNPSVQALMSTGLPDTLPQSFFDTELKEENRQNTMNPSVQALMSTGLPDTLPQSFFGTELKEENRQNTMNPSVQALMSTGLPDTLPQSFF
eukprot:338329_1